MPQLIHLDRDVRVDLEGNLVRKIVYRPGHSGLITYFPPKKMVERETRALQIVSDIPFVQKFSKQGETSNSFYSEFIPGSHLKYHENLPKEFFDKLEEALYSCRKRGVYRLDRILRAERDILVQPDLNPGIIDFGNIIFSDEPVGRMPGIKSLLEIYATLQMDNLRKKYQIK